MTSTTPTASPLTPGLAADDPRLAFALAVATARAVIEGVRADQLDDPTPCDGYDVRQMAGHLVSVLRRVAAVGRGESPFSVAQVAEDVADDGYGAAALAAAHEIQAAYTDAILDTPLVLPFATLPGGVALRIYTGEVSAHTWDLAVATGQSPAWSDEALTVALAATQVGLPAEPRGGEVPFGPVVAVDEEAPLIDRLVGWQGRDPRWSPPS